jgi:integrase
MNSDDPSIAVAVLTAKLISRAVAHSAKISMRYEARERYPAVVIPIMMQHYMMLERNLIYTAPKGHNAKGAEIVSARTVNNALAAIKQIFNFAVEKDMIPANLAMAVKPLKDDGIGWQPWPEAALKSFAETSVGIGRLGFYLALYTGQRQADCLAMRWDDIKDGMILVKQEKAKKQKERKELWIPIHPKLAVELERVKREARERVEGRMKKGQKASFPLTIMAKQTGQPYTHDGFGSLWHREQHRLNCNGLPFHGLRKNATIALLEAGCTTDEVKAITGHSTDEMVKHYAEKVNQKKLAQRAMKKLVDGGEQDAD